MGSRLSCGLVVLLCSAACSKKEPEPPLAETIPAKKTPGLAAGSDAKASPPATPTCEDIGKKIANLSEMQESEFVGEIVDSCNSDPWPPQARQCFDRAKDLDTLNDCLRRAPLDVALAQGIAADSPENRNTIAWALRNIINEDLQSSGEEQRVLRWGSDSCPTGISAKLLGTIAKSNELKAAGFQKIECLVDGKAHDAADL